MKPNLYANRTGTDDGLAINQETLHQYYCTVQSEVYPEALLDDAMNRRAARAKARRDGAGLPGWALWTVLALMLAGAVVLLR